MKVYIAAPFFNPKQVAVVEEIEKIVKAIPELSFYSPMRDGIIKDMTKEERESKADELFWLNKNNIQTSALVVAVIDDRDPGTIWEMGYAHAEFCDIVTFSSQGHGVNMMLAKSSMAHAQGFDQLREILVAYVRDDLVTARKYKTTSET